MPLAPADRDFARGPNDARWCLPLLTGVLIFPAGVESLTLALSIPRIPIARPLAVSILLISLFAAAAAVCMLYHGTFSRKAPAASSFPLEKTAAGMAIGLAGCAVALYALTAWQQPDLSHDGNVYHIPTIHFWAQRGYVHWITFDYDVGNWKSFVNGSFNGYPKAAELLGFVLFRALDRGDVVNTVNLCFLPAGVIGIALLARLLGASAAVAAMVSSLYLLIPVHAAQSPTTYVDSAFASAVIAAVAGGAWSFRELLFQRLPWRALPALAASLGLIVGIKANGVVIAALTLIMIAAAVAFCRRPVDRSSAPRSRRLLYLSLILAGTLLVGGYWPVRNYLHCGNPVHPVQVNLGGYELFPGLPLTVAISEEDNTPARMRGWSGFRKIVHAWIQGGKHWPGSLYGVDSREGGLGYLWIGAALPCVLLVLCQLSAAAAGKPLLSGFNPSAAVVLSALALLATSFWITPMNWWARYTVWIYGLGLPCMAAVLTYVMEAGRGIRRLSLLWLMCLLGLAGFESYVGLASVKAPSVTDVQARKAALSALQDRQDPNDRVAALMYPFLYDTLTREAIRGSEPVGLGFLNPGGARLLGLLCRPLGKRMVYLLSDELQSDPRRLEAFLREHHIRHVFWDGLRHVPAALESFSSRRSQFPGFWHVFEIRK